MNRSISKNVLNTVHIKNCFGKIYECNTICGLVHMWGAQCKLKNLLSEVLHSRELSFLLNLQRCFLISAILLCQKSDRTYCNSPYITFTERFTLYPCGSQHCNENLIYVFLFWELRGLSPNFHPHCKSRPSQFELYIPWKELDLFARGRQS